MSFPIEGGRGAQGRLEGFPAPQIPESKIRQEANRLVALNGKGLLDATIDAFDSLSTDLLGRELPPLEAGKLQIIQDMILAFSDLDITSVTGHPRIPRSEDRVRFLPGQHQGVNLQIATESGDTGFLNVYGGMRMVDPAAEMHDTDRTLRRNHSDRTDIILSQPVELNMHVRSPDDIKTFDIWLRYTLNNKLSLERAYLGDERVDLQATMSHTDSRFSELSRRISRHTTALATLIPSA